jgi:diaminopimelate epimerase
MIGEEPVAIMTAGGPVRATVHPGDGTITVDMGRVSFDSRKIAVKGLPRDVIKESIAIDDEELVFCGATIGNPHCVILRQEVSAEETRKWGPLVEKDARFPNRTNVQFMKVLDRANIQIEIWERGAGYTLASGSSASAAAAVAYRLDFCDGKIAVHMPGGKIDITVSTDFFVSMMGPVTRVAEGTISSEIFEPSN